MRDASGREQPWPREVEEAWKAVESAGRALIQEAQEAQEALTRESESSHWLKRFHNLPDSARGIRSRAGSFRPGKTAVERFNGTKARYLQNREERRMENKRKAGKKI